MPVAVMKQALTYREYQGWLAYLTHQSPDVQEIQMATLTLMVARAMGSKNSEHDDFIIRKPAKQVTEAKTKDGLLTFNEVRSVFAGIATPMG